MVRKSKKFKSGPEVANQAPKVALGEKTSKPDDEEFSKEEQKFLNLILLYIKYNQDIPETYFSDKYKNILFKKH